MWPVFYTDLMRAHWTQDDPPGTVEKPIFRTDDLLETQVGFKVYPTEILEKMIDDD